MFNKSSFRSRLFVTLVSIAVFPLVLLLIIALPATRLFVIERFSNQLTIVADLKTAQVNQWLYQGEAVISQFSKNSVFAHWLPHLQTLHLDDHQDLTNILEETVSAHPQITSASILHPENGKVILSSDTNLINRDWSYQDFFQAGKEGFYVSQVAYSIGRETPILNLSRPYIDPRTNNLLGVIVVEMNLQDLQLISTSRSGLGNSGRAYLVDKYGFYVTSPPGIDIPPLSKIAESDGVQSSINAQNGIDNYIDAQGVPVLGVYRWLEETNMGLLVEIDQDELSSTYRDLWILIISADFLLVLVALAAARSMTSRLIVPLESIATAASDIKAGDFAKRVPTDGPIEFAQVAESFNEMASTLQGSYGELESLVQQRTLALEQSEAALSSILATAPDAIISLNEDNRIIMFNQAAELMFDCTAQQVIGKPISKLIPEKENPSQQYVMQSLLDEELENPTSMQIGRDIMALRWNGEEFPAEVSTARVESKDRDTLTVILRDVTERNIVQTQINRSLSEKETLLKEIHHRIKNNLQIISSLLYLQTKSATGEDSIQVLEESQSRIKSMALIHESLYKSGDLSSIDLREYIHNLGNSLIKTYSRKSSNIKININIVDIPFSIDKALPLGLIINELISNSLKHGIPKDQSGVIEIGLKVAEEGKHTLVYSDDGVGIPDDVDIDNAETLGLHLVKNLVSQLDGQMQINRLKGTQFIITFDSS